MTRRQAHPDDEFSFRIFLGELIVFWVICVALVALVFLAGDYG